MAAELKNSGLDAYLCASPISMGYLHGFFEGGGERFMSMGVRSDGSVRLICPGLSESQARRAGFEDVRTWRDGENPYAHFRQLSEDWGLRSGLVAVDDDMGAGMLLGMQNTIPAARFMAGHELLSRLMRVKDEDEIANLLEAGRIADEAYVAALPQLKPGITELDLAEVLLSEMRKRGGRPDFCIVAAGKNGAEPHHITDDTVIQSGDVVVMDFGCSVNHYPSDITRTAAVGSATEEEKKVYRLVYDAHMAARAAIKPGVPCQEIDRAGRRVIDAAGYGEYFMHRLGHGLGMRGHEEPNMVEGNTVPLEPGFCFSIEPGIYLPGRFGVRIENIATATAEGHRSMNVDPSPELQIV